MSSLQLDIFPNPIVNPVSGFVPSSSTPIGLMVMSSMGYPFEWSWNSGFSTQTINPIASVPPPSCLPYLRESNFFGGFPFLAGTNPPRISPFLGYGHAFSGLPFPRNVNVLGSYPFPRGHLPPSNL